MALTYAQAQAIAAANQPSGGYTQDQINQWASWAVSNPDVAYSPNPAQQVKDSIVAAQVQAGERSAGNLTQTDVNQFNSLVASGDYTAAANLASSKGVDPAVTAAYINANVENLNLPSTFRVNASNVSSLAGQVVGPVNPATGPEYYPSDTSIKVDPDAVARAQAEADRIAAEAARARAEAGATTTEKKGLSSPALSRAEILELYRSIGMASPKDEDINFWLDYSQNNPDVINSANPRNQVINAFKAAAQNYGLNVAGDFGQFGKGIARPTITSPILPEGQVLQPFQLQPVQRGIQALRGPAYMSSLLEMPEGATNMTSPFGGSGLSALQIKQAAEELGRDPTKIASFMDQRNVSPAEYAAAFGAGIGDVQALYDASRPQGMFATPQPVRRQGPFALETGVSFGPLTVSPEAELGGAKAGGLISLAQGGMPKLSAREAGSRFDISEYIDPKTGRFYINEFQRDVVFNPELREAERVERERMSRMAQGGLASLAENLADRGRGGDSMLVHMSPEEVAGLRGLAMQMGSDLSINPQTGLPEAFSLKKLFRAVAPVLPFLIPGIGSAIGALGSKIGLGALASKSIAAGLIGGLAAPGKGFNFKQGLKTGLTAFAGGKLMEGLQAAGQMGAPSGGTADMSSLTGTGGSLDAAKVNTFLTGSPPPEMLLSETGAQLAPPPAYSPPAYVGAGTTGVNAPPSSTGPNVSVQGVEDAARGVKNIFTGGPEASAAFTEAAGVTPTTALTLGTTGYGLMEGDKERQAFKAAQAARERDEEERRKRFAGVFERTLGRIPMAAGGGMVAFADGGMPTFEYGGTTAPTGEPRMVKGAGDGMSDNVPANIEGVQEARLANDEFVIPADVVADIGNGSSSAGAKKLYAMMDRIRRARHDTTEQPPEIDAERLMPA